MEEKILRIHKLFDLYDEGEIEREQFILKLNQIYASGQEKK